jgi:hypothetical protein
MRNWLTIAALLVFAVSTGLLELVNSPRLSAALPPAMAEFQTDAAPAGLDATVTSGIGR